MRVAKQSVVILMFVLMLFSARLTQAAALEENQLSGRLVFERSSPCDRCPVSLTIGAQTVAMTYADSAGNFSFENVAPGNYNIHVEVPGYEQVDQHVDVYSFGLQSNTIILLAPKSEIADQQDDRNSGVIHVSQFPNQYPKKAIDAYKKGMQSRSKGNNADAIKYLEEAVRLAPTFYEAHNELGITYKQVGRADDAEVEFIRAHELNASTADPLINLTGLYIDENEPERAVDAGEKAVKTNGKSASAFLNLGLALYKAAMLDRAEAALKRALALAPKMFQVRLLLANVYLKQQRYDNLLEQLNDYLQENPKGEQRREVEDMRDRLLKSQAESRP
jgi:tetratricopeptide (TPR) repeat protein